MLLFARTRPFPEGCSYCECEDVRPQQTLARAVLSPAKDRVPHLCHDRIRLRSAMPTDVWQNVRQDGSRDDSRRLRSDDLPIA